MKLRKRPANNINLIDYYSSDDVYIWLKPFTKIIDEKKWCEHSDQILKGYFPKFSNILVTEQNISWKDLLTISKMNSLEILKEALIETDNENYQNQFGNFLEEKSILTQNDEEIPGNYLKNIIIALKSAKFKKIYLVDDQTMEKRLVLLDSLFEDVENRLINLMDYNRIISENNDVEFIFYDYIALMLGTKEKLLKIIEVGNFEGFWANEKTTIEDWNVDI